MPGLIAGASHYVLLLLAGSAFALGLGLYINTEAGRRRWNRLVGKRGVEGGDPVLERDITLDAVRRDVSSARATSARRSRPDAMGEGDAGGGDGDGDGGGGD